LKNIQIQNELYTPEVDHLWASVHKRIYELGMRRNGRVKIKCVIGKYTKGKKSHNQNALGIEKITDVQLLEQGNGENYSDFWNKFRKLNSKFAKTAINKAA
jgi:hypothetical protein